MEARTPKAVKIVQSGFLMVVAAFLCFPIANDIRPVIHERAPHGMPMAYPAPPLTKASFMSRSWQRAVEPRAKRSSGLWYPLTLLANEIYARAFGQISAFNHGSVRLGNDNHLFQTAHLSALNHKSPKNLKKLPQRAADIKELQERLKARGTTLLIVVTPNMATLYPELIPSGYLDPSREQRKHPYEEVESAFDEKGIAYVDTVDVLRAASSRYPFRLFAPTASHWNDVASCLALEAINSKLKDLRGASFRAFSCDRYTIEDGPRSKDRDLLEIANLLFPERLNAPTPYVQVDYLEPEPKEQPSTLLVGTSYLFALSEHLHDWNLAKSHNLYFYFRKWRKGGESAFHALTRNSLNWDEIFSNRIIIVNVGIGNPVTIGYGFIEAALTELRKRDTEALTRAQPRITRR